MIDPTVARILENAVYDGVRRPAFYKDDFSLTGNASVAMRRLEAEGWSVDFNHDTGRVTMTRPDWMAEA